MAFNTSAEPQRIPSRRRFRNQLPTQYTASVLLFLRNVCGEYVRTPVRNGPLTPLLEATGRRFVPCKGR